MQSTLVINVVGLTSHLLGPNTPHLCALAGDGAVRPLRPVVPAVTCTVQSTLVTGKPPSEHGIVANGWYFRELSEVWFWRQSNKLVSAPKVWELARQRDPDFTVANLFWWYNMYSSADWSVTPRPMYPADGRKLPDVYSQPGDLRDELNGRLGQFPLFRFWGPAADISSSRWITDAALHVMATRRPTLALVYLPHLDYVLQRVGPNPQHPDVQRELRQVDALCGELIEQARATGRRVLVVSEYGINAVNGAVHLNRALRQAGWLRVREEMGREQLDAGASDAFAVVDHQLAHVYVRRPELVSEVRAVLAALDGVEAVWGADEKRDHGLDHPRSGELIALSRADKWFSYYYWLEPSRAPDYARTVDIHRKPGYDPVELFLDPELVAPKLAIGWRLAKRAVGMRTLMDVISCEATHLVGGSHGRVTETPQAGPVLIAEDPELLAGSADVVEATDFAALLLRQVFGRSGRS